MPNDIAKERPLTPDEERTESAHQRTILAEERTYSAWVRTGLASAATGLAIAKLIEVEDHEWLILALGALFVVLGGIMFCVAYWGYLSAAERLRTTNLHGVPMWAVGLVTVAFVIAALGCLVVVFL